MELYEWRKIIHRKIIITPKYCKRPILHRSIDRVAAHTLSYLYFIFSCICYSALVKNIYKICVFLNYEKAFKSTIECSKSADCAFHSTYYYTPISAAWIIIARCFEE